MSNDTDIFKAPIQPDKTTLMSNYNDSGVANDVAGGNLTGANPTNDTVSSQVGDPTHGPSSGFENNVDRVPGEKKEGTMSKIKKALLPDKPGETKDTSSKHAASHLGEMHAGKADRMDNMDLNRE